MTAGLDYHDDDSDLDPHRLDKIVLYSKGATKARENGDEDEAEKYFQKALNEVREYISELEERRRGLQEQSEECNKIKNVISDLEDTETNLRKEIKLL